MTKRHRSTREKINALSAAREWLGTYDGDHGPLDEGNTEGVPADMVAAYELLGEMIGDLLELETLAALRAELRRRHPHATAQQIGDRAKQILRDRPDLVPAVV
jgi:hypothetical protein